MCFWLFFGLSHLVNYNCDRMASGFITTPPFDYTSKSTYYSVFTLSGADQQIFTLAKTHNLSAWPCWTVKVKTERMPGMLFWGVKSTILQLVLRHYHPQFSSTYGRVIGVRFLACFLMTRVNSLAPSLLKAHGQNTPLTFQSD